MLVLYKSIIFHMCSRQTKAFLACMYKHLFLIGCAHLTICNWAYHYTNITRISMRKCLGGKFHLFWMSETDVNQKSLESRDYLSQPLLAKIGQERWGQNGSAFGQIITASWSVPLWQTVPIFQLDCPISGWTYNLSTLSWNDTAVNCHSRWFVGWMLGLGQNVMQLVCGWSDHKGAI